MIDNFVLTKDYVQIKDKVSDWKEAITLSAKPLLENGLVEQSYIDAMISSVEEFGPYIVIAPHIAMPHARPETGSKEVGFAILKLNESVSFSEEEDHQVKLLVSLSCKDANTHIKILQSLVEILSTEEKQKKVINSSSIDELMGYFKGGDDE